MSKEPQLVLRSVYAFPPNRYTLGGTSYLIVKSQGNLLIDCPRWTAEAAAFIRKMGGVTALILTHRGGRSQELSQIQADLGCQIVVQEQEAYLVPTALPVESFHQERSWPDDDRVFWTAGHSPGSACFYSAAEQALFTGRHLLPNRVGDPQPLKFPKTFHWPRQLSNVQKIVQNYSAESLRYILPGASTGLLRGEKRIPQAYERLRAAMI